jgi:hypothetical protein
MDEPGATSRDNPPDYTTRTPQPALLWVSLPFATFGLVISSSLQVVDSPPIARYTLGWNARDAWRYFAGRGAQVLVAEWHGADGMHR